MNNIQLSILLNKYYGQLIVAVARIEEQLPDEMSEMQPVGIIGNTRKAFPILYELANVLYAMSDDADKLERFSGIDEIE